MALGNLVAGLAPDLALVEITNAAGQRHLAEIETVTVFAQQHFPLLRHVDRLQGHVVLRREGIVVGQPEHRSQIVGEAQARHQHAAAPVHRRVGMAEIGHVGDGKTGDFHHRVLIDKVFRFLVMHHLARLQLPQWRAGRVLGAQIAGRIDSLVHLLAGAADAPGTVRGKPGIIGQQHAQLVDEAVAQIAGQFDIIGEDNLPAWLHQHDIAGRRHLVGLLIVGHQIGAQHPVILRQLDIATRGDCHQLVVIIQRIGGKQHRRLLALALPQPLPTPLALALLLGMTGPRRQQQRAQEQHEERGDAARRHGISHPPDGTAWTPRTTG